MPGSVKHGKHIIKNWINKKNDISTILDIGCGSGTYAKLLGDKYKMFGVDVFAPYIDKFDLNSLYDGIIVAQAEYLDPAVYRSFDCVIFGDVLEHMKKEDAKHTLLKALMYCNHVVVSIPIGDKYGKEHYNNHFEKHKSVFSFDDIDSIEDWEVSEIEKDIGVFCK